MGQCSINAKRCNRRQIIGYLGEEKMGYLTNGYDPLVDLTIIRTCLPLSHIK